MLPALKKYWLFIITILLLALTIWVFCLNFRTTSKKDLTFAMLDIGQGDALFVESPAGNQLLIDAGPPRKILGALSRLMPPFDRTIEGIIITNPDQDHIGGFADILKSYKVGFAVEPGTYNVSKTYENLKNEIEKQKIPLVLAKKGMRLNLGGGAVIDILFPDQDVSSWTTNDGSIVAKLSYGQTSVMLTGDATSDTERLLLNNNSKTSLESDILKVGHHGSKTSTSESFVQAVSPTYALISDGKDNKYGHPHEQTLETLEKFGVKIFRTDLLGTIIMKSDGKNIVFPSLK